jgi:hypothetical protein
MSKPFTRLRQLLSRDIERLAAIRHYIQLRDEAWQTLADGLRQGEPKLIDEAARKMAQADEAAKAVESANAP